ncbi:MAG TPA: SMI1/KNR4 family protein [Microvirga sp.]|jgi:hypothetical protein
MARDVQPYLAAKHLAAPATEAEIENAARRLRVPLPADYARFLQVSNGYAAPIGQGYAELWPADRLGAMNESLGAAIAGSGIVLIGCDGGPTGFGFAQSPEGTAYGSLPLDGSGPTGAWRLLGRSFHELIYNIFTGRAAHPLAATPPHPPQGSL